MVESTFPDEGDTIDQFAEAVRQATEQGDFPEERLLQLAFLAPQWTEFVEATIQWDGLAEGLYWYMAHMGRGWDDDLDDDDQVDEEDDSDDENVGAEQPLPKKLSHWERLIRERTELTAQQRQDGAIDVAWFHRTYKTMTPKRWQAMADAAKFSSSGAGGNAPS